MEIRRQYIQKYLHDIAIDQLADDYISKGYHVDKEKMVGRYHADLVAEKENETIVVEVRTGKMTPQKRSEIAGLSDYVRNQENHKFLVVLANPPTKKQINIPNIKSLLLNYFLDHSPDELNNLSTHTRITSVEDVNIYEVTVVEQGDIIAKGNGLVETELQYGSSSDRRNDEGTTLEEVFPFNFEVVLTYTSDNDLHVSDMITLTIDVSGWYQ